LPLDRVWNFVFFRNNKGLYQEVNLGINNFSQAKTVQWVDFDNDEDLDLFVTSNDSPNRLYENNGAMNFTDVTDAAGLLINDHISWGSSWGDYDHDGFLDLFVTTRNAALEAEPNYLYRNNGDGTFENVTVSAGLVAENYLSFCSVFFDYNRDGLVDIYVSNDKNYNDNLMYENQGDGTFLEVAAASGTNVAIDAMSTTIGDDNRDGYMDIYVTNTEAGNAFLRNNGNGTFSDVAHLNGTLFESVGWGASFLDADNDMDLDLYVSSSLYNNPNFRSSAFYENNGSGLYIIPENIGFEADEYASFSNAIGDVNNDGYPDIVVSNMAPHEINIWLNGSQQNANWLKVKLQGTISNKQGIGAYIEISSNGVKQYNFTNLGEGYLGQNSAYEFFGIGAETAIEYLKVTWPSRVVDFIEKPMVNQAITIIEGENPLTIQDMNVISFRVYPNPARNEITMEHSGPINGTFALYSMFGDLILQDNFDTRKTVIGLGYLSAGVYFLKVNSDEKISYKKIIVE